MHLIELKEPFDRVKTPYGYKSDKLIAIINWLKDMDMSYGTSVTKNFDCVFKVNLIRDELTYMFLFEDDSKAVLFKLTWADSNRLTSGYIISYFRMF